MNYTVYTITGCTRCKILKQSMSDKGLAYEEQNSLDDGKEAFQKFYAQNRKSIVRGPEGIEFPILFSSAGIQQGLAATLAHILFGSKLDGFVTVGSLHKEWVDGFHISGGDPAFAEEFVQLLIFIKGNNMKLQVETDGRNSAILERILTENLADRVIFDVRGPETLYANPDDVRRSIELTAKAPAFTFQTKVSPALSPDEVGETARWIAETTGSMKTAYLLRQADPNEPTNLLPYRSNARKHLVLTEIEATA